MIDKRVKGLAEAVAGIKDGSVVLCAGFGGAGLPDALCEAVIEQGARDLTVVANNAGTGRAGLAALMAAGRVAKIMCSFPRSSGSVIFEELYTAGKIELELLPQGTLSERMRCAAAGLGGYYSPVSVGTRLAQGKEHREIDGRMYVLEKPLKGDVALLVADRADRWGNLTYRKSARNFNPTMAMAADLVDRPSPPHRRAGRARPRAYRHPRHLHRPRRPGRVLGYLTMRQLGSWKRRAKRKGREGIAKGAMGYKITLRVLRLSFAPSALKELLLIAASPPDC